MIQITGLTKVYRRGEPPAVLDLTFDARPGAVTALLGPEGAGKSTALRLMLELERGHGVTLFGGRTYRRLRRPEREVGVLLMSGPGGTDGAVAGHPGRRALSHLRMLAAAAGVPARRADELLEQTRLATVAGQRLRSFSPGMHRRLALATALLGDPGTLVLDAPTEGLSPRNVEWFHSFLRSFAVAGGTVLVTTRTPQEAARLADRVVTLDQGRMLADQPVTEFCRTRLSPEVAVRGPQMARLADLLVGQGAQVRRDGGAGLAVAGIGRTEIGELAYQHGILLHELADRVVEQPVPRATLPVASGRSGQVRQAGAEASPAGRAPGSPASEGPAPDRPVRARAVKARQAADDSAAGGPTTQLMPRATAGSGTGPQHGAQHGGQYGPQYGPESESEPAGAAEAELPRSADRAPATGALPALALPSTPSAPSTGATAVSAATALPATARTPWSTSRSTPGLAPRQPRPEASAPKAPGHEPITQAAVTAATGTPAPAIPEEPDALDLAETSPTVAVDRLFRDGLRGLARSVGSGTGTSRAGQEAAEGDLLTADTVRLGRLNQADPAPAHSPAPSHSSAPAPTPVPTPDHRSE
ncbi:ATP-binding cassette domain-containing protein [Kitasatospora sp. NBC_01560]|uniref:ATP-binding cassette domain-containing protein n=1 Tax=Kitasatospora sp. NBC_01560 TaxID=2975965 RepID=UPI003866AC73